MRILVFSLILLSSTNRVARCEDTAELARRIIKANRDYEASLVSFRIEYDLTLMDSGLSSTKSYSTWTWARSGRREVVFTDPTFAEYGPSFGRVWSAFNGKQATDLSYAISDAQRLLRMDVSTGGAPRVHGLAAFDHALGWHCLDLDPLVSMMEQADHRALVPESAKFSISSDKVVEFPSLKWPLKRFRRQPGLPEHEVVVWLSEEHGWLPRMISTYPAGVLDHGAPPAVLPYGSMPYTVAVEDFLLVADAHLGQQRHCPGTIYEHSLESRVAKAISVVVNQPIPAELFEPVTTPGALIVKDAGTQREHREFAGGANGEQINHELQQKEAAFVASSRARESSPRRQVTAGLGSVNAAPATLKRPISTSLIVASLILLVIVGIAYLRKKPV